MNLSIKQRLFLVFELLLIYFVDTEKKQQLDLLYVIVYLYYPLVLFCDITRNDVPLFFPPIIFTMLSTVDGYQELRLLIPPHLATCVLLYEKNVYRRITSIVAFPSFKIVILLLYLIRMLFTGTRDLLRNEPVFFIVHLVFYLRDNSFTSYWNVCKMMLECLIFIYLREKGTFFIFTTCAHILLLYYQHEKTWRKQWAKRINQYQCDEGRFLCSVCFSEVKRLAIASCGHAQCMNCAPCLRECPMCKKSRQHVYIKYLY